MLLVPLELTHFKMLSFFPAVILFSLTVISYHPASATAEVKMPNQEELNAFLDRWKPPKEILDKFPYYVSGFDIEKRPVFIFEVGKWPIRSFVEKGGKDLDNLGTHMKQFFRRMELGPKSFFNASDLAATDSVLIIDWAGFSLTQLVHKPTVQYILHHFTTFQRIQDSLAYGFYLNVNTFASHFISLAKPILGSVLERIEILGTQKSSWIPKLLRTINADQLPPWYGGVVTTDFKPVAVYG